MVASIKPKLQFKEIGVDTNEKDRERKLEDQRRWEIYFHKIVVEFFESCNFQSFHQDFDPNKDQLDVFVPTYGSFMCGQRNPGKRKGKNKIKAGNSTQQSGCGRRWNSYLTMTKFGCKVNGNDLEVTLRQFGQRCLRCSKVKSPYENPSFTDKLVDEITKFLLVSILDGIFNYINRDLCVDFDVLGGPRRFRRDRFIKKQTKEDNRQSSDNTLTYNEDPGNAHNIEQISESVIQTHEGKNCEACDKDKGCGKRRKRRRRKKKVKETEAK